MNAIKSIAARSRDECSIGLQYIGTRRGTVLRVEPKGGRDGELPLVAQNAQGDD